MIKNKKIEKVLLINPFQVTSEGYNLKVVKGGGQYAEVPLGLAYIAAMIKQKLGLEVDIFDANIAAIKHIWETNIVDMSILTGLLEKKLNDFAPDLVGVSCLFHAMYKMAHYTCSIVKKVLPQAIVVMGGIYPTVSYEKALLDKNVDLIVLSEGEIAMVEIIQALNEGDSIDKVDGIVYRDNGGIVVNPKTTYINLDELPEPARELLPIKDYTKYSRHFMTRFGDRDDMTIVTMTASRGCPFSCAFCAVRLYWGSRIRYRSPRNVLNEIESLIQKYDATDIVFNDDNFAINNEIASEILDGIIEKKWGIRWVAAGGLSVASLKPNIIEKMCKSGNVGFNIGIESGCKEILRKVKKPVNLDKVPQVIKLIRDCCNNNDYIITCFFMVGFPFETKQQIEQTYEYARGLDFDWVLFSRFQPYPGTLLYELCIEEGYLSPDMDYENLRLSVANIETPHFDGKYLEESAYLANLEMNFVNSRNLKHGDLDRAIKDFNWVLEMVPDHAIAYYCLGQAYFKKGLREAGLKALRDAQKIVQEDEMWKRYFDYFKLDVANEVQQRIR